MWVEVLPWALLFICVCWLIRLLLPITEEPEELEELEEPVEVVDNQEHYIKQIDELNEAITILKETTLYLQDDKEKWESEVHILEQRLTGMTDEMKKQKGRAQSAHTSKGQILEKWAPFVSHEQIDEHWKSEDWCFLGQPIDYVVFDWHQDKETNMDVGKVVLLDVKAAKSQLTTKQRRIRDLIIAGKVEWRTIRLD
jgi:predicted Holliday junction resolvase-like endonuclease|tara:strand:- start:815 stop:1405 length:591 start_codon:yes stop_codon:yes gene_type:complete